MSPKHAPPPAAAKQPKVQALLVPKLRSRQAPEGEMSEDGTFSFGQWRIDPGER